ncbi:MAG: hypothetical protein WCP31_09435 [Chloroflexales bacterium]
MHISQTEGGLLCKSQSGLAVIGGLLVSQFLTLYLTPVIYIYFERLQVWLGGRKSAHATPAPQLSAAAAE